MTKTIAAVQRLATKQIELLIVFCSGDCPEIQDIKTLIHKCFAIGIKHITLDCRHLTFTSLLVGDLLAILKFIQTRKCYVHIRGISQKNYDILNTINLFSLADEYISFDIDT